MTQPATPPTPPTPPRLPMTPAWSRALALLQFSPLWRGPDGSQRWQAFVAAATRYPDAAALPEPWQAIYREAARQQQGAQQAAAALREPSDGAVLLSNPYEREAHGHFGHGGDHGEHPSEGARGEGAKSAKSGAGEGGGKKPNLTKPKGYAQILTKEGWQPAKLNLHGEPKPIAGHEGVRFPNTDEGKAQMIGWMREHAAGPKPTVSYAEGSREKLTAVLGREASDAEVAGLAGALPGAKVSVSGAASPKLEMLSADGHTRTTTYLQSGGGMLNWEHVDPTQGALNEFTGKPQGVPTAVHPLELREQVRAARRFGIQMIHMKAQFGSQDAHTLPRLGYNARMDQHLAAETVSKKIPNLLAHFKTLLQAIGTPQGAAWWAGEGQNPGLDFDTKPNSASSRQLVRVLAEYGHGGGIGT